jgi:hypothetical protein
VDWRAIGLRHNVSVDYARDVVRLAADQSAPACSDAGISQRLPDDRDF